MDSAAPLWFLVGLFALLATAAWVKFAAVLQREGVSGVHIKDAMRNAAVASALVFGMTAIVAVGPVVASLLL